MPSDTLVMIAPAPAVRLSGTRLRMDTKFVEGTRLHVRHWGGPVRMVLWQNDSLPFGEEIDEADLGFELVLLAPGEAIRAEHVAGAGLIAASADMHQTLGLPAMERAVGTKLVYSIEYTLDIRLQILRLEQGLSLPRKLRSAVWLLGQEYRRRRAMRAADGVQFNGWPAEAAYKPLNRNTLLYLDNRMRSEMIAEDAELAAKAARLEGGAPLRIAHFGRLEALKGAQDIVPVACALRDAAVDFTLDIWGTGSLADGIRTAILANELRDKVRLHEPLPFETGLVPVLRQGADLFLSCHRQGDPSCSYLEAMGCGLPVIGYDNVMLRNLADASGAARVVRMGDVRALASGIAEWASLEGRTGLATAAERARDFVVAHDFETEFARRMAHLVETRES